MPRVVHGLTKMWGCGDVGVAQVTGSDEMRKHEGEGEGEGGANGGCMRDYKHGICESVLVFFSGWS